MEKLRSILLAQVNRPSVASSDYLFELAEKDAQAGGSLNARLKQILFQFFERGKSEGYIDEVIPFELLYLHSENYRAGYKANLAEIDTILISRESVENLNHIFFWEILKRKG